MTDQEKEIKTVLKSAKKHNNLFKIKYTLIVALGYVLWTFLFVCSVKLFCSKDYLLGIFMLFILLIFDIDKCIIKQLLKYFKIDD